MFKEGYIGMSTVSARSRWNAHRASSKLESKSHLPIYRAFKKYGIENLIMSVLVVGPDDYITNLEVKLRPHEGIGWNCAMGGQDTGKGRTQSPEEIEKRASKIRGTKHTAETRKRMSDASKGKPKSPEHRIKCGLANLGKKRSEQVKKDHSEKMKGLKKITEQGRKALSDFHKNLHPWQRSRSNNSIWYYAEDLYNTFIERPITKRESAKILGVKDSSTSALCDKILGGWVPVEDVEWLTWRSSIPAPILTTGWIFGDGILPKKQRPAYVKPTQHEPWLSKIAKSSNWAFCEEIAYKIENKEGFIDIYEWLDLDPKKKTLESIFKKIRSGWNPKEDVLYQEWLTNLKEAENV